MKKFLYLILIFALFCSACKQKSSDVTVVTTGLSFTAAASYLDNQNSYSVIIGKNGNTKIGNSDNSEQNITYHFEGQKLEISYNDLLYKCNLSAIKEGSIPEIIYYAFICAKTEKVNFKNNEYFITCKNDKYKFKIYLGQTGLPIKITEQNFDVIINILNPTILK